MTNKPAVTQVKMSKTIQFVKYPNSKDITVTILDLYGEELALACVDAQELTDALFDARGISTPRWACL